MAKRSFGSARKRASGRWQARYTGPDGKPYTARMADGRALTFDTRKLADGFLAEVHSAIQKGQWVPPGSAAPAAGPVTLSSYSRAWLATRTWRGHPLSPGTKLLYRLTLDNQVLPDLGGLPLASITPVMVREWHAGLQTGPTQKAHAYSLLRTIMRTALLQDELITANPCRIEGAGQAEPAGDTEPEPATLAQLEAIVRAMPERCRLMVLLAAWCALRFGELAELRRTDIDVKHAVVRVRRGVIRGEGGRSVKDPKSRAGKRGVSIPPHLMPAVEDHLRDHVAPARDALLFPSRAGVQLSPASLYAMYYPARKAAGRPDLRFHDLRHTGATLAAHGGATLKELMARLGHSTVSAAMRYQHVAAGRDKVIAASLSDMATGTVTPIGSAKGRRKKAAG
jgi:integrase